MPDSRHLMFRPHRGGVLPAFVLLIGSLATGCGGPATLTLRPGPRAFTARDYEEVYEAWTRDADEFAFGRLKDVLDVTATFQSWEMRWAYVVRYSEDYAVTTDERAEMLRATLADAREFHRFFISLFGTDWRSSDLTNEESAWRVVLVDPRGAQTVPVEVEAVERPAGRALVPYFPSISPFRREYRVVFPAVRPDGSETIPRDAEYTLLRFTGSQGRVDLRWDFSTEPPAS